jgi:hypothetical protein
LADWEGGVGGDERQRNVSAGTKRMSEAWMDQHLVGGRGGPSLLTGRGECAWMSSKGTSRRVEGIVSCLLQDLSLSLSSVVPFSLSRKRPSNSPYQKITLKTNKKIFNERAR